MRLVQEAAEQCCGHRLWMWYCLHNRRKMRQHALVNGSGTPTTENIRNDVTKFHHTTP